MKFERMKFFVNMILFIVIAYVQEIYETYLDAEQKGHLEKELEELKKMTPKPMNVMLNKQPRDEAIKKRNERRAMVVKDVPPTATGMIKQHQFYYLY